MADTDGLIKEWEASRYPVHRVAAAIARKIASGHMHRYENLPLNSTLAAEYNASKRTISAAKKLLGDHGILKLKDRRYYVA